MFGSFDSASAQNPGSTAGVTGTATDYTIFSHAVETAGGTTIVTTSFDPSVNVAPSGGESFVAPTGHEMLFMPDHMMPFVP
ncbi:hypothetical protein [Mycobacterium branderi]|uniref:Uncharacterized protein n=1 Tax=Mycobacterium branderi TaxID=43348 RepID=A0A7I7W5X2_9MYCO|nr:hypothetical protein [Mycobacterium branderi]MCV7235151.1 hypothetical protein [Mycobacterium branderi]ORA33385.1 hypothetical protein BST20_22765 [Mycobacterium branderi]BBZ12974.1 hypothetical protein MBRA_31690 [Mycobacterium branderi]